MPIWRTKIFQNKKNQRMKREGFKIGREEHAQKERLKLPNLMTTSLEVKTSWEWQVQSFPYENYREYYKKLAWRLWSVLFTLTEFFLIHGLSLSKGKWTFVVIAVFLSKLGQRPLLNGIYYEIIPVRGLVSIWLTNATLCLL